MGHKLPAYWHLCAFAEVSSSPGNPFSSHLSWLRSPPRFHFFISLGGLCGGGRLCQSCGLNVRRLCPTLSGYLTFSIQGRGPRAPLVLGTGRGPVQAWWVISPAPGHVTGNRLSIHKPTAVALEVNREMERDRPSLRGGARPGTWASVHMAFRVRISPHGMGIAAEGEERLRTACAFQRASFHSVLFT